MTDGIRFASKREATRYSILSLLEKNGKISGLELQPEFVLHDPHGNKIGKYVADFAYMENGERVIEDAKSTATETALFKWKRKHVEGEYGIKVKLT